MEVGFKLTLLQSKGCKCINPVVSEMRDLSNGELIAIRCRVCNTVVNVRNHDKDTNS